MFSQKLKAAKETGKKPPKLGLRSKLYIQSFNRTCRKPQAASHNYTFSTYFRKAKSSLWFYNAAFFLNFILKKGKPSGDRLKSQLHKLTHTG